MFQELVIIRGGGDIASGTIQKLHRSGFKVLVLEIEKPTFIRRKVCYGEAIYEKEFALEGATAKLIKNINELEEVWMQGKIPVLIDKEGYSIEVLKPRIVVDAILAKKNLGTHIEMADITIALGPGFEAGKDVHAVIETMRGHNLGRIILSGCAIKNTGIPGEIKGFSKERVIYSPSNGIIKNIREIGDVVKKDDLLAYVEKDEVLATLDGVLRGIIRDGSFVNKWLKIADIDPRLSEKENCFTISDKARAIGGAVLEAILYLMN
ncbi:selenium-dependent molybdenum cofactor biosynthesis protein YqeB [Clostridium swellfunianum]|uniref:selenium-dependent molybdenum cofactor biosynthesis protein YqeB n=1 Tax=Clostridium swellfunianum TaxID=1367462 RepID=UPI00202FFA34|nr:selenium-dependent molybdenum cofactor biosynthesis protein YqeB [Clostridium swellfunianum]MCM0647006.1 selenium-dependent molybdenum cofactor biosynthesis protein YqeB [Clostridium swellfunianum]